MSFVINKKLLDMQRAIAAFRSAISAGEITLPGNLDPVFETTEAFWPTALIIDQKVVPISYDVGTNTISLDV